jgi:hypothetical protein
MSSLKILRMVPFLFKSDFRHVLAIASSAASIYSFAQLLKRLPFMKKFAGL